VGWTHAPLGRSGDLQLGAWCVATGHPGGWQSDRGPVARVGRVLANGNTVVVTDCTLLGGDSGGPLFDMNGRVIGIHSRITNELTDNMHVPIDGFRDDWTRLVNSEKWGHLPGFGPIIGVQGDPAAQHAIVTAVVPDSPADKAGIQAGDIIVEFDGVAIGNFESLRGQVSRRDPGDRVNVRLKRGGETLDLRLVVGRQR
jgi:serine protease Do